MRPNAAMDLNRPDALRMNAIGNRSVSDPKARPADPARMGGDKKADRLGRALIVLCLALMVALMLAGDASPVVIAIVVLGAGLVLSACFLADHRSTSGR